MNLPCFVFFHGRLFLMIYTPWLYRLILHNDSLSQIYDNIYYNITKDGITLMSFCPTLLPNFILFVFFFAFLFTLALISLTTQYS